MLLWYCLEALLISYWSYKLRHFLKQTDSILFEKHTKSSPINSTNYTVLYAQNGDRAVNIDYVTSLHAVYTRNEADRRTHPTRLYVQHWLLAIDSSYRVDWSQKREGIVFLFHPVVGGRVLRWVCLSFVNVLSVCLSLRITETTRSIFTKFLCAL